MISSSLHDDAASMATTESFETFGSTSSATTVWGPGTLSGKAIKSLGEASLQGLGNVIFRLKLAKISSSLRQTSSDKQKIYDDLLELSRLDYYTDKVRQKALRLIMIQVGSREISALVQCISKWPEDEIRIFLSEIIPCVPLIWGSNSEASQEVKIGFDLLGEYRSAQLPDEEHEVLPFLNFIHQLSCTNARARWAILHTDFISVLVKIHQHCDTEMAPGVITCCVALLQVLLEATKGFSSPFWDPFRMNLSWPRFGRHIPMSEKSIGFSSLVPRDRRATWNITDSPYVPFRLSEIEVILDTPEYREIAGKDLFDLCVDLLGFSLDHSDREIANRAQMDLHRCISLGGVLRASLIDALSSMSYKDTLEFFYRTTYPLLQIRLAVMPLASSFYQQMGESQPNVDVIESFALFALEVAQRNREAAEALIDADIVVLLTNNRKADGSIADFLSKLYQAKDSA